MTTYTTRPFEFTLKYNDSDAAGSSCFRPNSEEVKRTSRALTTATTLSPYRCTQPLLQGSGKRRRCFYLEEYPRQIDPLPFNLQALCEATRPKAHNIHWNFYEVRVFTGDEHEKTSLMFMQTFKTKGFCSLTQGFYRDKLKILESTQNQGIEHSMGSIEQDRDRDESIKDNYDIQNGLSVVGIEIFGDKSRRASRPQNRLHMCVTHFSEEQLKGGSDPVIIEYDIENQRFKLGS